MKTATFMGAAPGEWTGIAKWYRLAPPLEHEAYGWDNDETVVERYENVILSATVVMFSGPETYIFPANEQGEIQSWSELDGSRQGTLDHEFVLGMLGYRIKSHVS